MFCCITEKYMKTLQSLIPKQLVSHHIAGAGLWALMIDQIKVFCSYPEIVTGYLRHHILFVQLDEKEDKLAMFHKKKELIEHIHMMMQKFGYQYILKDIRLK